MIVVNRGHHCLPIMVTYFINYQDVPEDNIVRALDNTF